MYSINGGTPMYTKHAVCFTDLAVVVRGAIAKNPVE